MPMFIRLQATSYSNNKAANQYKDLKTTQSRNENENKMEKQLKVKTNKQVNELLYS